MRPTYIGLEINSDGDLYAPVYRCDKCYNGVAVWNVNGAHLCNECKERGEQD